MAINLNRVLPWTDVLKAHQPEDAATLAMLCDLQGNILKGHGRDQTINVFLSFDQKQAQQAQTFLAELARGMPSALDQLMAAQVYKASGQDAGLFLAMFLSAAGYRALGLPDELLPVGEAFRDGMKSRQQRLQDPAPDQWQRHFAQPVHGMLLLAHDSKDALLAAWTDLQARIGLLKGAVAVVGIEEGIAHRNGDKQGIEHFGYVDGRSQPLMLQEDVDKEEREGGGVDRWDPRIPLAQVLVPCPGGLAVSCGSYFVFRKLEQHVRAFKQAELALAEALKLESGENPGELAGAYVVGRFENGTPVSEVDHEQPVGQSSLSVPNNFNFDADPAGLRCPFAGHIRKTNPRDPGIASTSRLMARRGITFGARADGPNDGQIDNKPEGGVGLLFMAYQASIEDQFEFTQESWANSTGFHFKSPVQPVGIDPVIGQPRASGSQRYPLKYREGPLSTPYDFSGHVTLNGGEYFFAPSLSFFKNLA